MTTASATVFTLALATIIWGCVLGLQRPPPRYSQQYMPQTSFTCRNKIVGSYYADPETDCQLFHVCVSVAGSIQDYRFLCPNDTAFDQESQTCADWYDVDCEAATLYYASDNFDLYRIGSGLESLHYDSIRSDFEPQDHLQRSESNDPIRSPLNSYNSNNYKDNDSSRKSNARSNNNDNYESKTQKQTQSNNDYEKQKNAEPDKKVNLRKISRKPAPNAFNNAYTTKSTTVAPAPTQGRFNDKPYNQNLAYSTARPSSQAPAQKPVVQASSSTARPTTKYAPAPTTLRSTANSQDAYSSYQTTTAKTNYHNGFNNFNRFETTAKPSNLVSTHYPEPQSYSGQFSQPSPSTTKQPDYQSGNYEQRSYSNYESNYNKNNNNNHNYNNNNYNNNNNNNHNYNNNQRTNSTTAAPNNYDNNYNVANYEPSKKPVDYNTNSYTSNTYAPTTYSPVTKKFVNRGPYYEKSTTLTTKAAQYSDTESTKAAKKVTNYKSYNNNFESSTRSYDFGRSSVGLGFSPSSVNHLAENFRSTTPTPRRAASPTTYNPNNFNVNTHAPQSQVTQQKSTYYQNQSAKQYSTTAKYFEETTARPKITKKNDYDYAYYDNGPVEYDNLELEHVGSNKESVKIT